MATRKIKTMSREQLENELREALKEVKDQRSRECVCDVLFYHINQLDNMQGKPYEVRCVFWKCFYILFNYLRILGQLGREQKFFDRDVKNLLKWLLEDLKRAKEL